MARRLLLLVVVVSSMSWAVEAKAQGSASLSWYDCGAAGQDNAYFGCDTNTGPPYPLLFSFVPPMTLQRFVGIAVTFRLIPAESPLPDWWRHGTDQCRGQTGLVLSFDFLEGPYTCVDAWGGRGYGGFAYDIGYGGPDVVRVRVVGSVLTLEDATVVEAGTEYYGFKLKVIRSKTTGSGSCSGCESVVCFFLDHTQLFQPPDAMNDPTIDTLDAAVWQNGIATIYDHGLSCTEVPPTPTRAATWGSVKRLYR
jgi:hypothetical protein